jgi:hypothetical protein
MSWHLIKRSIRAHLKATNTGLPSHRNKPSATITTRFLPELFPSVQTIVLDHRRREKATIGF